MGFTSLNIAHFSFNLSVPTINSPHLLTCGWAWLTIRFVINIVMNSKEVHNGLNTTAREIDDAVYIFYRQAILLTKESKFAKLYIGFYNLSNQMCRTIGSIIRFSFPIQNKVQQMILCTYSQRIYHNFYVNWWINEKLQSSA